MTTFNFTCHTNNIEELYDGANHYVAAQASYKPEMGGWYTIYELVLSPLRRIQIMEMYEETTYDIMFKVIYLAERGWRWHPEAKVPALNDMAFDSVATELWIRRIGLLLADDRMTQSMFTETQRLLNFMRLQ